MLIWTIRQKVKTDLIAVWPLKPEYKLAKCLHCQRCKAETDSVTTVEPERQRMTQEVLATSRGKTLWSVVRTGT